MSIRYISLRYTLTILIKLSCARSLPVHIQFCLCNCCCTHTLLSECRSVAFAAFIAFIILHFTAWNFVSHVLTHFPVAVLYTLVSSLLFGCASSLAVLDKWAHTMIKMWHIVAHSFILIPMFFLSSSSPFSSFCFIPPARTLQAEFSNFLLLLFPTSEEIK